MYVFTGRLRCMTNLAAKESEIERQVSQMRCIGCGTVQDRLRGALRCPECGDLLEITYPGWKAGGVGGLRASELKALWRQRRTSPANLDQSGVWRFRDVLPAIAEDHAI